MSLDPSAWIHAVVQQIPDPGQHMVRYYGAYANRKRRRMQQRGGGGGGQGAGGLQSAGVERPRSSWCRLLHKILEVDPLLCPRCRAEMKIVSVITDAEVVDRILRSLHAGGGGDPFEERAPPWAVSF